MTIQVQTKASKRRPSRPTKYSVAIEKNKSIAIFVDGVQVNSFNLGDEATYDSWNLIYTGPITKITEKTVQITSYPGTQAERRHNLDLERFCWKNETFDAAKAAQQNQETMYYI